MKEMMKWCWKMVACGFVLVGESGGALALCEGEGS
jgi:hypothetical protein